MAVQIMYGGGPVNTLVYLFQYSVFQKNAIARWQNSALYLIKNIFNAENTE
jgi:hypothetical protein